VVVSSGNSEPGSSLSPVPSQGSEYVDDVDAYNSSYSTSDSYRPSSADSGSESLGSLPFIELDGLEEPDISDDYSDDPSSESTSRQSSARPEPGGSADGAVGARNSRPGPRGTLSAWDGLRAIQAELIPGYDSEGDGSNEKATRAGEREDSLMLLPGLSARSMPEGNSDIDM
jgi:hypothetical protein